MAGRMQRTEFFTSKGGKWKVYLGVRIDGGAEAILAEVAVPILLQELRLPRYARRHRRHHAAAHLPRPLVLETSKRTKRRARKKGGKQNVD